MKRKLFNKILVVLFILLVGCSSVKADVTWNYIKNPKYVSDIKNEYNKIPESARSLFDEKNMKITLYGYNHYKNWVGLFNGKGIYVESYQLNWLKSYYKRKGIKVNYSKKKLSVDYAESTLIHELGHAYDYYSNRPSHNSDFTSIYKSEKSKFKKTTYYKYPMAKISANLNGVEEYFASSFDAYIRSPKDLKKRCPKTYNYFQKLFNK